MNGNFKLKAAFVAGLALMSTAACAIDLIGSFEQALSNDPDMLAANEAVLAGREKAVQGTALLLPQIALSSSYSHVRNTSSTDTPTALSGIIKPESSGKVSETQLQLKQPLYDAKSFAEKKQLHEQAALAEVSFGNARQDLAQRVSQAYFNVLLAQESVRVAQAEKAAVGMQRDRAQARFDVGMGNITDVQETKARYDSVAAKELSALSTLSLRQSQYRELTGATAAQLATIRTDFTPSLPQPQDVQTWETKALDHNTLVLSKQGELAIAEAETDKHTLHARPKLDLVASYTAQGQSGTLSPVVAPDGNRTRVIGVQLSIPLFAGGALDSQQREANAKRRQAQQELAAAQRDARLQVQDAYLSVTTGVSRVNALSQSVVSARTALDATTLGRDVGNRTELDVLDAQQRLFTAQLDLAQARNDYLLGRIRLAYAAGELGERDLRALNDYLAP